MDRSKNIALMLNETVLFELKRALNELEECTSLAQARGGLHNKVEAYERANKKLKAEL